MTMKVTETVAQRLRASMESLTPAERRLASTLLDNYPIAGLSSIAAFTKAADVSAPTAVRMAKKLGFSGFPGLQAVLREELEARLSGPIARHDRWAEDAPEAHILNRYAEAVMENMQRTIAQVEPAAFDRACARLSDSRSRVHSVGGRITHALADYFVTHLQVIRERVVLMSPAAGRWPHDLLNMEEGDLLVVYDIRRYENDLLQLSKLAAVRGVEIILFTDPWMSPIASRATHSFTAPIEAPSGWDSCAGLLFLTETMIAAIEARRWGEASERMRQLDGIFDETRHFRRR